MEGLRRRRSRRSACDPNPDSDVEIVEREATSIAPVEGGDTSGPDCHAVVIQDQGQLAVVPEGDEEASISKQPDVRPKTSSSVQVTRQPAALEKAQTKNPWTDSCGESEDDIFKPDGAGRKC